jgi:hypothetical protein
MTEAPPAVRPNANLRNRALWILLIGGCLLHVLFGGGGIGRGWDWDSPISVFILMTAYALPGVLLSIIFIVPLFWAGRSRQQFTWRNLRWVVWSVYIGFGIRMLSYLLDAVSTPHSTPIRPT